MVELADQPPDIMAAELLFDEILRLCDRCDAELARNVASILRRAPPQARAVALGDEDPAVIALRMLTYLNCGPEIESVIQPEQLQACLTIVLEWAVANRRSPSVAFAAADGMAGGDDR